MGAVVPLRPPVPVFLVHPRSRPIPYGTAEVIERYPDGTPKLIRWQYTLVPLDRHGVETKPSGSFTLCVLGAVNASYELSPCLDLGAKPAWSLPSDDVRFSERCPPGGIGQPA